LELKPVIHKKTLSQPEIVPDRIKSPFNYKILAGIITSVIIFHIMINVVIVPEDAEMTVSIFSVFNPLIASIIGFIIAFRYKGSKVFQKAYLALSVGLFAIFLGEITYFAYDLFIPDIEPYPSIADIFFFAQYPLILTHLIINIRFFSPKLNKISKIWMIVFPISILASYAMLSGFGLDDFEPNFDFYYGAIFVYASSLTLSVAIVGAIIFKEGVICKVWLLLVIGILCNTIGDTWYYNLEVFDQYDLGHPVNLFWYAGYWIVIYALIKHRNVL